jgi:hypothetical protein
MCVMLESNQLPIVWIEFAVSIPKPLLINNFMHIYDTITRDGRLIHLSMLGNEVCYIMIHDLYTHEFKMRYFTDQQTAVKFIRSL